MSLPRKIFAIKLPPAAVAGRRHGGQWLSLPRSSNACACAQHLPAGEPRPCKRASMRTHARGPGAAGSLREQPALPHPAWPMLAGTPSDSTRSPPGRSTCVTMVSAARMSWDCTYSSMSCSPVTAHKGQPAAASEQCIGKIGEEDSSSAGSRGVQSPTRAAHEDAVVAAGCGGSGAPSGAPSHTTRSARSPSKWEMTSCAVASLVMSPCHSRADPWRAAKRSLV